MLKLKSTLPLSPISIPLSNSHIQSLKLNYLSWISICSFLASTSALPCTTKPLIHTANSTTIHHIPDTAKRASHTYRQLLRLRCICSDQAGLLHKVQEMESFFERHGCSAQTLKHDLEKMKHPSRSDALTKSDSKEEKMNWTPLLLTYHPLNTRIQRILLDNFKVIADDPATSLIFPQPSIVTFHRNDSSRTSLVHTAEKQAATCAGTYPFCINILYSKILTSYFVIELVVVFMSLPTLPYLW